MANHPASLTNLIYLFVSQAVAAAVSGAALFGADVQDSDAEPLSKTSRKTIRIGSYDADAVQPLPNGQMKEINADPAIEFIAAPLSQSLAHRVEAREIAHQMAMETAAAIARQPNLNGGACHVEVVGKSNGYRLIKDARHQISILSLIINRKGKNQ